MDKEDIKREEMQQELNDDLEAEANTREFTVFFKGKVYIETHDKDIAIDKAIEILNEENVYDYVDSWETD